MSAARVTLRTWTVEDHLCRACGGRILKCATGRGATPGGNPIWRCASCGDERSDTKPAGLCWCGVEHRGQRKPRAFEGFLCLPFSILTERPELRDAFLACGCDPDRDAEVGILTHRDYQRVLPKEETP